MIKRPDSKVNQFSAPLGLELERSDERQYSWCGGLCHGCFDRGGQFAVDTHLCESNLSRLNSGLLAAHSKTLDQGKGLLHEAQGSGGALQPLLHSNPVSRCRVELIWLKVCRFLNGFNTRFANDLQVDPSTRGLNGRDGGTVCSYRLPKAANYPFSL
jgi:hypothetical protein